MGWDCPMCSYFAAPTLKGVVRHIGAVHSFDAAFHVHCGIGSCPKTYTNWHSYKKHMYSRHRDILDVSSSYVALPPVNSMTESAVENADEHALEIPTEPTSQVDKKFSTALFIMKAKEVNKISQSSLNALLQDVTAMMERKISRLEEDVSLALGARGMEMDTELQSLFRKPELVQPFQGLDTEFLQKKFFRETFGLLVSLDGYCRVDRSQAQMIFNNKLLYTCMYLLP